MGAGGVGHHEGGAGLPAQRGQCVDYRATHAESHLGIHRTVSLGPGLKVQESQEVIEPGALGEMSPHDGLCVNGQLAPQLCTVRVSWLVAVSPFIDFSRVAQNNGFCLLQNFATFRTLFLVVISYHSVPAHMQYM